MSSAVNMSEELAQLGAESVSPVTLSSDWSRVARLLLLASLAVVGSVGNVFMISAVMIEDHLKKRGNALLVSVALADLLVTGLVIPASTVVILAGLPDSMPVCRLQLGLAALCCLVTVVSLAAAACENHARICLPRERHARLCTRGRVTAAVLGIWVCAGAIVALQASLDLGPNYCPPSRSAGLLPYHAAAGALLMGLAFVCHGCTAWNVRSLRARPSFRPAVTFAWDYALMKTNAFATALFVVFWMPFAVTLGVASVRDVPARIVYNLAWFALSKSCVNNLLYCAMNRHFRNAYVNLFHYCCCKTTVSFSRRQRGGEAARPSGDVRVHIIPGYNMYSYTSPQRARDVCSVKRSTGSGSRPNGRDIYEL